MAGFFRTAERLAATILMWGALAAVSCSSDPNDPPPYEREAVPTHPSGTPDAAPPSASDAGACSKPAMGCPCDIENQSIVCGTVHEQFGDYVRCDPAYMHCVNGAWGECAGDRVVGTR